MISSMILSPGLFFLTWRGYQLPRSGLSYRSDTWRPPCC